MGNKRSNDFVKITMYFILILGLAFGIYKTSCIILTNSFVQNIEIDDETSSYLSLAYVDDNNYSVEVSNPKVISDFRGKHLLKDNRFDFVVSIPKEYVLDDSISYDIVVDSNGESIDDEYVKFYLTDQDNNPVSGYKKNVPVMSMFDSVVDGKVIYSGVFKRGDLSHKFRLRIWISDSYDGDVENVLSYNVKIRINDK